MPETSILGAELVGESVEVARLRARHYGRDDIVIHLSPDGNTLPAGLGRVDFIVMNAVFEHLLPRTRAGHGGPLGAARARRRAVHAGDTQPLVSLSRCTPPVCRC
ncbi:MAG: hypothetical protein IPG61_20180 [bacterium]|nr:hypothetical protein [bacterium]